MSESGVKTPFPIQINRIRSDSGGALFNSTKRKGRGLFKVRVYRYVYDYQMSKVSIPVRLTFGPEGYETLF